MMGSPVDGLPHLSALIVLISHDGLASARRMFATSLISSEIRALIGGR